MQQGLASRVSLYILLCIFAASCASSTVINSEPQGASVYVDGVKRGITPYTYTDRKTIGSTTSLTLKKDGYEEFNALMVRNEEFDAAACAGGVFLLVPFLWVQKYSPERTFELTSIEGGTDELVEDIPQATPQPTPAPPPEPVKKGAKGKAAAAKAKVKSPPPPKGKAKAPKKSESDELSNDGAKPEAPKPADTKTAAPSATAAPAK